MLLSGYEVGIDHISHPNPSKTNLSKLDASVRILHDEIFILPCSVLRRCRVFRIHVTLTRLQFHHRWSKAYRKATSTAMAFKIPLKRCREHSITTPTVSRSNSRPLSSVDCSSLVPRRQALQPRKYITLCPPDNGAGSNSPVTPCYSPARPEDDEAIAEREEDDSLNEVVMAVDMKERGTVGCCYYVAREEKFYILEDVECGGLEVIDTCMLPITLHRIYLTHMGCSEITHPAYHYPPLYPGRRGC